MQLSDDWQRCYVAFLDSIEAISGSTRSRTLYSATLRAFFRDGRSPDSYSANDVRTFLSSSYATNYHRGKPVQAGTQNQRLMVLNSFYKFAATYEVNGEPILQTKPPTYGLSYLKVGSSPRAMSASELSQFFSVIPTNSLKGLRDRAIFLMFFWTGRRRSEIARLRWRDIEQAIIVDPDGTRRPGVIYRYVAKGKSRETQTAELPAPAWRAILAYLDQSTRASNMMPDDPLFAAIKPGTGRKDGRRDMPMCGDYLNLTFKQYCSKAGLPASLSLHSLRHTAAHERYTAGQDIVSLKEWLGHSSLETTYRYIQSLNGASDTGARLLESRFSAL